MTRMTLCLLLGLSMTACTTFEQKQEFAAEAAAAAREKFVKDSWSWCRAQSSGMILDMYVHAPELYQQWLETCVMLKAENISMPVLH